MFNRIRRAVSRTRERYLPKGRHRRPLTPDRPTVVHLGRADWPTTLKGQCRDRTDILVGEETALVRPYVLACEERARRRSAAISHELLTHTWFARVEAF
ncbi:hypothetical protein OG369_16230 [Streptomyces sp. NBC_01221]|uniref:hypothetical protein n=1 Tax=Streptomyces sp. NBC_01221 TaxID=2903782 RepID=UPI00224F2549|nr:hypothetical protein [Streptomyces sp. NBC_01221]MCX4787677.1 hypothetical protein [Streptomyces sp. NBC_01221]